MTARPLGAAGPTPWASLFLALPAAAIAAVPPLAARLELDRTAVGGGEWWRLLSGHWTHWSIDHLAWDGVVFLVLAVVAERISRTRLLASVAGSAVLCSLAVWWLLPSVAVYRGLSGIDSALFVLVCVTLVRDAGTRAPAARRVIPVLLLTGFLGKIAFETMTGTTVFVDSVSTGTSAVPLAHAVGALVGGACGAAARPTRRGRPAWATAGAGGS